MESLKKKYKSYGQDKHETGPQEGRNCPRAQQGDSVTGQTTTTGVQEERSRVTKQTTHTTTGGAHLETPDSHQSDRRPGRQHMEKTQPEDATSANRVSLSSKRASEIVGSQSQVMSLCLTADDTDKRQPQQDKG